MVHGSWYPPATVYLFDSVFRSYGQIFLVCLFIFIQSSGFGLMYLAHPTHSDFCRSFLPHFYVDKIMPLTFWRLFSSRFLQGPLRSRSLRSFFSRWRTLCIRIRRWNTQTLADRGNKSSVNWWKRVLILMIDAMPNYSGNVLFMQLKLYKPISNFCVLSSLWLMTSHQKEHPF